MEKLEKALQSLDLAHKPIPHQGTLWLFLQECASTKNLACGRLLHSALTFNGLDLSVAGDCFVRLFASCGSLFEACLVFCTLTKPSVYTWHAITSAYVMHDQSNTAFALYHDMQQNGVSPNEYVITCLLKACSGTADLGQGMIIHDDAAKKGHTSNASIGTALIDMYAKCGNTEESVKVFNQLPQKDLVTWSTMMEGLVENGNSLSAIELVERMHIDSILPDKVIFLSALKACGHTGSLQMSMLLHGHITRLGLDSDVLVGNTLLDVYAKCGALEDARKTFDGVQVRTLISYGAMISGYANSGHGFSALKLLETMQCQGIEPNEVVFSSILKACGSIKASEQGKLVHHQVIASSLQLNAVIGSSLVDMYSKTGNLQEACQVFNNLQDRNVITWGAMISGHAQYGDAFVACRLFLRMLQEGFQPAKVTCICVLKAFDDVESLQCGKQIHDRITRCGLESDEEVVNALINMYGKCGSLDDARNILNSVKDRSTIAWSAMIAGSIQHGHSYVALEDFERMQQEGVSPDRVTFLCAVKACTTMGMLCQGNILHDQVVRSRYEEDMVIGNALIDLYVKCRCLQEAKRVFDGLRNRNVITWGAMIAGYAIFDCRLARQCLFDMQQQGLKPNEIIYTSLLSACCQMGKVKEGNYFFRLMADMHGISPRIEHLTCMVDLFGGAGYLKEAERLLQLMPKESAITAQMSLLTACKIYGSFELGRQCFDQIIASDPQIAAGYVLMADIYTAAGMLEDAQKIHAMRSHALALKMPGKACIDIDEAMEEFIVGQKAELLSHNYVSSIKRFTRLKANGYVPQFTLMGT